LPSKNAENEVNFVKGEDKVPSSGQSSTEVANQSFSAPQSLIMALILGFLAACAIVHVAQPVLSPFDDAVSFYMNGRLGGLLGFGIVALGAGSLLLLLNIRHFSTANVAHHLGSILFGAWGIGCVVAGIFPPDAPGHWDQPPSFPGAMHNGAAMLLFLSFPVGALMISKAHRMLKTIAVLCAVATLTMFGCLAPAFQNRPPYALGLVERVVLALNICWLLAANQHFSPRHLRKTVATGPSHALD
jgi:hypothetical protein